MDDEDDGIDDSVPFQSHSITSIDSARKVKPRRAKDQERWVYEALRRKPMADWQLRELAWLETGVDIFEQDSSKNRARIGLVWVTQEIGATKWHPVEDSGLMVKGRYNVATTVWRIKEEYRDMPYDEWRTQFKNLARRIKSTRKRKKKRRLEDLYYDLYFMTAEFYYMTEG